MVAHDGAGNTGSSSTITVTVPPDTTAPSAPGTLTKTGTTTSAVSLAWTAATDDRQVAGYQVLRDGSVVGNTGALSYTDTGLAAGTTYTYTVQAVDGAGNVGPGQQRARRSPPTPARRRCSPTPGRTPTARRGRRPGPPAG